MKKYFLVVYNYIKLKLKSIKTKGLSFSLINMFGINTKIVLGKRASVILGDRIVSDGRMVIIVDDNASLTIGSRTYFNENAMISCKSNICIGKRCRFGPNVKIFDNDHEFDKENGVKSSHKKTDIIIGDNCWIASNVVILRGTNIGDNCVIGAGCVVKGNIPHGSIVKQNNNLIVEPIM